MITRSILKKQEKEWETNLIHIKRLSQATNEMSQLSCSFPEERRAYNVSLKKIVLPAKRKACELEKNHQNFKRIKIVEEADCDSEPSFNHISLKISDTSSKGLNRGQFIVERILNSRYNKELKHMEYLVKWEGFGYAHNTWEPFKTLNEDVPELIKEHHDKLKAHKKGENCVKQIQNLIKINNCSNDKKNSNPRTYLGLTPIIADRRCNSLEKISKSTNKNKQETPRIFQIQGCQPKPLIDNVKGAEQLCKLITNKQPIIRNPEEQDNNQLNDSSKCILASNSEGEIKNSIIGNTILVQELKTDDAPPKILSEKETTEQNSPQSPIKPKLSLTSSEVKIENDPPKIDKEVVINSQSKADLTEECKYFPNKTLIRYSFTRLGDIKAERNRLKQLVLRLQTLCVFPSKVFTTKKLIKKCKGQIYELKKLYMNILSKIVELKVEKCKFVKFSIPNKLYFPKVCYPNISEIIKKSMQSSSS